MKIANEIFFDSRQKAQNLAGGDTSGICTQVVYVHKWYSIFSTTKIERHIRPWRNLITERKMDKVLLIMSSAMLTFLPSCRLITSDILIYITLTAFARVRL